MMKTRVVAALGLVLATAAPLAAQEFDWRGRVGAGQTLEIKNINGEVVAVPATGNEIRVTARKTARRSNPDDVRIEVVEHSGGVTICSVYPPGRDGRENECAPGNRGRNNAQNNDTRIEFRVEVPSGVRFNGRTVNGNVDVRGLGADVSAHTVNGDVDVSTSGSAEASTVNGNLDIEMGRSDWRDELEFETVNGRIALTFSGDLNAEVDATTVNGSISTDYPLTIQGRFGPKRLRGTVGSGGRTLSLSTVNGSIELRRR